MSDFSDNFSGDLSNWDYDSGKWAIVSGAAVGTPALEASIITDGDMEYNYPTGPDVTYWPADGSPTTREKSTDQVRGGNYSLKIVGNQNTGAKQTFSISKGVSYSVQGYVYVSSGRGKLVTNIGASAYSIANSTAGSWTLIEETVLGEAAGSHLVYVDADLTTSTVYFEDVSVSPLTLSNQIMSRDQGKRNGSVQTDFTISADAHLAGIVARLDSASTPANFVAVYYSKMSASTKLYVYKVVSGTWTLIGTPATITYSAGKTLKLIVSGNTYRVYYDGTQYMGDLTIDEATINSNTRFGLFTGHPNVSFDNYSFTDAKSGAWFNY